MTCQIIWGIESAKTVLALSIFYIILKYILFFYKEKGGIAI